MPLLPNTIYVSAMPADIIGMTIIDTILKGSSFVFDVPVKDG
jgi:hypothetical protein